MSFLPQCGGWPEGPKGDVAVRGAPFATRSLSSGGTSRGPAAQHLPPPTLLHSFGGLEIRPAEALAKAGHVGGGKVRAAEVESFPA